MHYSDAFALLNVLPGSSSAEIRRAWRMQSTSRHPDVGGSNDEMVQLNIALEIALNWAGYETESIATEVTPTPKFTSHSPRFRRDVSSFTIDVLPVECWQALEIAAAHCGPTIHDEPPYVLEFMLHDTDLPNSHNAWCRCECVPEAGATTVHLSAGTTEGFDYPDVELLRDFLVNTLNSIDWPN